MAEQFEPQTTHGRALRDSMSGKRWEREIRAAVARAKVVDGVNAHREATQLSWRLALAAVAPEVSWPTFANWRRKAKRHHGEMWERMLDERSPPNTSIAPLVVGAARMLRQLDRSITTAKAREHLIAQFGDAGAVSDAALRRLWAAAGLANEPGYNAKTPPRPAPDAPPQREEVEHFNGGAGLALVMAADVETGTSLKLAQGIERAIAKLGPMQGEATDDSADRDADGHFTAAYNARRREGAAAGEVDERWSTDQHKAAKRNLSKLRTAQTKPENIASKLFAMGATPLLTERRGFDGLDGPSGTWLGIGGDVPYMPATLDKTLAELGLLGVDETLWDVHAAQWSALTQRWSKPGPPWLQTVAYIDGTADPYWTRAFAKSSKVSRIGRVMPCISRVALNSGAGVPLLVRTFAGTAPLKHSIGPMLEQLRTAVGPQAAVDRFTVIDSEAGNAGTLWALHSQHDVFFVTVIKGAVLAGADLQQRGLWQSFRERDELCESDVLLKGKDAPPGGLPLRAIQMRRSDGRRPQTTVFTTNASEQDLSTEQAASLYLTRWPLQEQTFRNARDGGGLNRSFGYGREQVVHVALAKKLTKADARVDRAAKQLGKAAERREIIASALADAASTPSAAQLEVLALADEKLTALQQVHTTSKAKAALVHSMPTTIQQRDVGRDSIMTCLKLSVLSLAEFVLKEYFGSMAAEWRTYIEQLVALPVTVRTTADRRLFQIHANRRQPERMAQLAVALAEVNRRQLRQGKRLLEFEVIEGGWRGS